MMREQLDYLLTYHGEGCKIPRCPDCMWLVRIAAIMKERFIVKQYPGAAKKGKA